MKHVVMVTAENGSLRGGKIGGLGDVINYLPKALAQLGWKVTVVSPSYGFLHKDNPSKFFSCVKFPFAGKVLEGEFWKVVNSGDKNDVTHFLFEHPEVRGNPVYFNDPPDQPFLRDATKFALFCSAVGKFLKSYSQKIILHLHDWHSAFLLLLMHQHADFAHLKGLRTVFTLHNPVIKGTRPLRYHYSSLEGWFPELFVRNDWVNDWTDFTYGEPTFTPMMVGIRFADKVNTVSPSYAEEIVKSSDISKGFYGGEGLENDLLKAKNENRLYGILNGCEYDENISSQLSIPVLSSYLIQEIMVWKEKDPEQFDDNLIDRVRKLETQPPALIATNVTRVVEQKVKLFFEWCADGEMAIEKILAHLQKYNGVLIMFGSGVIDYEEQMKDIFTRWENFIFLNGYSERIAQILYSAGDVYLMPSIFEPCGISQMYALSYGQPCIVHAVGGLKDTVVDGVNGFLFSGKTLQEKAEQFVKTVEKALDVFTNNPTAWDKMKSEARKARFTWEASARKYIELLYS